MNLSKNENVLRRTYIGMKILGNKLASERTKVGRKLTRYELHQNITPSAPENMPKGKYSGMNIQIVT